MNWEKYDIVWALPTRRPERTQKTLFIFAFLFYELFTVCYLSFNTAVTWSQSINKSSAKCSVWTMETVSINFMLLYKLYCPFQIRFSNVMENDAEAVGPRLDRCTLLGADILIKKLEYYKDTACCWRYYPAQYELEGWFAEAVNVSSPVLLLPSQNTSLCLTTVWQRLSDWHFLNTFTSPQRYSGWLIDKFGHDKWRCVCMSFWSQVLSRWTSGWLFYLAGTNISNLYSSLLWIWKEKHAYILCIGFFNFDYRHLLNISRNLDII